MRQPLKSEHSDVLLGALQVSPRAAVTQTPVPGNILTEPAIGDAENSDRNFIAISFY